MKALQTVVLASFLLWGTSLLAQFDVGVVLPFENNTRDPNLDWISESFVEVLSEDLASPRFILLDRRERAAVPRVQRRRRALRPQRFRLLGLSR